MTQSLLPNLVIAGVGKAGTTSLFWYLSQHPDICPSRVKEIDYFAPLRDPGGKLAPVGQYADNFRHWRGERYRLEASPGYLYGGSAVRIALADMLTAPRLIVILRDPAERVFPSYRYLQSHLQLSADVSYREYVERCLQLRARGTDALPENRVYWTISAGFYENHVAPWLDVFGDSLRVLFFDDLVADPQRVVGDLCSWLDIASEPSRTFDYGVQNRTIEPRNRRLHSLALSLNRAPFVARHRRLKAPIRRLYEAVNGQPRKPAADKAIEERLQALYAPANAQLARLLQAHGYRALPPWLSDPVHISEEPAQAGEAR